MKKRIVVSVVFLFVAAGEAGAERSGTASATPFPDQLTLYAIPAPKPAELSWETPGKLVRNVLFNTVGAELGFFTRTLGHMGVHVQCGAANGLPALEWKGSMTNAVASEFRESVLKQGFALGVLFHNFTGRYERPDELQGSVDERYRNGRIAFVRFGIRAETCRRLLSYAEEFDRLKVNRYYGLAARARYKEGAGCSDFSVSVVEIAGLMEKAFRRSWTFDVRVPLELIGGPTTGKKVSIVKAALARRWALASEPHRRIAGWDPTLAYRWIRDAAGSVARGGKVPLVGAIRVERRGEALGLVLDRRTVPTPTEPFWKN